MHCARHSIAAAWLFNRQRRAGVTPVPHVSVTQAQVSQGLSLTTQRVHGNSPCAEMTLCFQILVHLYRFAGFQTPTGKYWSSFDRAGDNW